MPYDKSLPYACRCCGYWNGDMKYDYYKPKEPYIKDEKVRKALKAWLVANGFGDDIGCHTSTAGTRFSCGNYCIEFLGFFIYDLIRGQKYCIEELCGVDDD